MQRVIKGIEEEGERNGRKVILVELDVEGGRRFPQYQHYSWAPLSMLYGQWNIATNPVKFHFPFILFSHWDFDLTFNCVVVEKCTSMNC